MGAGQEVIASLLGHTDSATTERYTHVVQGATTASMEARWARLRRT
jgi:site-specific recombinase XerD